MTFRDEIAAEPWRFDLFAVLRRLEAENQDKPRIGASKTLSDEFVSLSQDPYLSFAASNIESAEADAAGKLRIKTRFLGMFGPQGALPLSTTAEAFHWVRNHEDAFARFVDIFQRRFLHLFFRAWADARPIAQSDRPADDRFRVYVGSTVGLGGGAPREAAALPDFARLQFAGVLGPRVKSASRLRTFLNGLFGTPIEIEEFVGAWLRLEPGDCTRLGGANARLGEDAMLGESVFSVSDKFRVRVYVRDIEHFRAFLPGGKACAEAAEAIAFYLGDEYDWEMELAIPAGEITPVRLGHGGQLGWTSWMSPNWARNDQSYRTDARFHVVSRMMRGDAQMSRN